MAGLTAHPAETAPRLLGALLTHAGVTVRLTEVEAYGAADDPGSHCHRGPTRRNATMFGPPGRLYVYLSYGMHHCANVVTGLQGCGGAVLLRAGEVVAGHDLARGRRTSSRAGAGPVRDRDLARGPGCLCRALGLHLADDGLDLGDLLVPGPAPARILAGPRVGLRLAADRPWRFWAEDDRTVSRYVRSPRAESLSD